jgi:vitamin B12 transporter
MPVKTLVRLGLALSLTPCAALADPLTLSDIVVTATGTPTPEQKIAAGVTVITQKEMQARGETTLVQALAAVPGVGVVQSGGDGTQGSVFVRGSNSEDVLVLLDGVPVNDPSDPNGAFNFGTYTVTDIARIEVVRGPMSSLYGSNAIGGVINIITVQGSGKPKASIELGGGWPAQGQGSATLSGSEGKFDYALSGALDEEAGFDQLARRLAVYAGIKDPFRSKLGDINLGYTPMTGTRISFMLRAQHTDAGYPDLGYPIYDDPDEYEHNTSLFGKLGVDSTLLDGALTTSASLSRQHTTLYNANLLDANDPNYASADDHYNGFRTDAQDNNTLHLPDAGPVAQSSILFGVEYIGDSATENVDEYEGSYTANLKAAQHATAGHVGGQTTLFNMLTFDAAMREDAVSSFGNALTGRIGAVLAVPDTGLRLKSSYATGFLAPSLFDLYGVDDYGYKGNPNLKPERSAGFDAGAAYDLPENFGTLSASYFASTIKDLITSNDSFTSEINVGAAEIAGVETEFQVTPASWLSADLNYTYTHAENADTGTELLRRPEHAGSATATITPIPSVSLIPQVQYIGAFTDYLYDNSGIPLGDGDAKSGTIVNLTGNYKLSRQLTFFAQGKNILDSHFEPVNGLQIPGASLLLGVRAEF